MTDAAKWAEAHRELVTAVEGAKEADMLEEEVLSVVDDVYHEDPTAYQHGGPKPPKGA